VGIHHRRADPNFSDNWHERYRFNIRNRETAKVFAVTRIDFCAGNTQQERLRHPGPRLGSRRDDLTPSPRITGWSMNYQDGTATGAFRHGKEIIGPDGTIFVGGFAFSPQGLKLWRIAPTSIKQSFSRRQRYSSPPVEKWPALRSGQDGDFMQAPVLTNVPFGSLALCPMALSTPVGIRDVRIKVPCGFANSAWPMDRARSQTNRRAGSGTLVRRLLAWNQAGKESRLPVHDGWGASVSYRIETSPPGDMGTVDQLRLLKPCHSLHRRGSKRI